MSRRRGIGTGSRVGQDFRYRQNRERSKLIGEGVRSGALNEAWVMRITETRQSTVDRAGNPIPYTHTEMVPVENAEKFKQYKELGSSRSIYHPDTGVMIKEGDILNTKFYILGMIGDGGSYRVGDLIESHGASNVADALIEGIMQNLIEVSQ